MTVLFGKRLTSNFIYQLVNLVPTGDYGSDDDEEDDPPETPKKGSGGEQEEDEDVRMMQALECGTESDLYDWRHSGGVDLLDVAGAGVDVCDADDHISATVLSSNPPTDSGLPETVNIPKTVQRRLSIFPRSLSDKYHSVFGNLYRRPPKPLSSSAKQYVALFLVTVCCNCLFLVPWSFSKRRLGSKLLKIFMTV